MTQYTIVMQNGRPYRVPVEHARKFVRKNELVSQAMGLKAIISDSKSSTYDRAVAEQELRDIMGKIIRLNRRIPPCAIPV